MPVNINNRRIFDQSIPSDHFQVCFAIIGVNDFKIQEDNTFYRNYKTLNLVNFKQDLLNSYLLKIDLTEISLDELTNKYNYELLHLLNKHSPLLIKKPFKNKKDNWFDSELTNLLKHCRKTERKWRKTQSVIHKAEYKYFQKL